MALADTLRSLQEVDFNDLDLDNIGSWPTAIKAIVWVLLFIAIVAGGYFLVIQAEVESLEREQKKEIELKRKYVSRAEEAANLDDYLLQMKEIEKNFGVLLGQLPEDTEVPGLIEDISNEAVSNGLVLDEVNLRPERPREFYFELPIDVKATGNYHDFGSFVSGVASLPRIVTLHDFAVSRDKFAKKDEPANKLKLEILAKTYRYKGD